MAVLLLLSHAARAAAAFRQQSLLQGSLPVTSRRSRSRSGRSDHAAHGCRRSGVRGCAKAAAVPRSRRDALARKFSMARVASAPTSRTKPASSPGACSASACASSSCCASRSRRAEAERDHRVHVIEGVVSRRRPSATSGPPASSSDHRHRPRATAAATAAPMRRSCPAPPPTHHRRSVRRAAPSPRRPDPAPRWNSARCHELWTAKKLSSLETGLVVAHPARRPRRVGSASPAHGLTACCPQRSRGSSSTDCWLNLSAFA